MVDGSLPEVVYDAAWVLDDFPAGQRVEGESPRASRQRILALKPLPVDRGRSSKFAPNIGVNVGNIWHRM